MFMKFRILFAFLIFTPLILQAQESVLADVSGDGTVRITAFGDSLTFGVGDGTKPG